MDYLKAAFRGAIEIDCDADYVTRYPDVIANVMLFDLVEMGKRCEGGE